METVAPRIYHNKDLTRVLDISRSSLRYYERMGLIQPERTRDHGYRQYSDSDIRRILSYLTLKNIEHSSRDTTLLKENEALFNQNKVANYRDTITKRMQHDEALIESLDQIAQLNAALEEGAGKPTELDIPTFVLYGMQHAQTSQVPPYSQSLRLLSKHAPLASLAAPVTFDPASARLSIAGWGCAIPEQHQRFAPVNRNPVSRLGGERGLCFPVRIHANSGTINDGDWKKVHAYLAENIQFDKSKLFLAHGIPTSENWFPAALYATINCNRKEADHCEGKFDQYASSPSLLSSSTEPSIRQMPIDALTTREHDVFTLLTQGYDERDLAQTLVIALNTVHTHICHIYRKLHVHSRQELINLS